MPFEVGLSAAERVSLFGPDEGVRRVLGERGVCLNEYES